MSYSEFLAYEARSSVKAGKTPPRGSQERESVLQDEIETYLKSFGNRCWYDRKRMDKPSTSRPGVPDFIGWIDGKPFAIECKVRGKPTPEQNGELHWAKCAGAKVEVVYSLEQAVAFIKELLPYQRTDHGGFQ